jgi:exosome complex component RRP46
MSLRSDGRSENTLRQLSCEFGCLQNCDGSAIWKSGETSVLAAVHGPIAPRQSQYESARCGIVTVVLKGDINTVAEWESFLTQQLTACIVLESYPRSVISVVIQILADDGSVLAAALHSAVSALMDASIDMNYLPTAVTCFCDSADVSRTSTNFALVQLDPTLEEEQSAQAVQVLVFCPKQPLTDAIVGCHTTASMRLSASIFLQWCDTASRAVSAIQAFWRLAIEKVTMDAYQLMASSS